MAINFLDTIKNNIPVAILESKDVKGTILIDPDPNLPASFLQNSAILNRVSKTLTFHDEQGHILEELDLTPTDVEAIDAKLAELTTDVTAAQERADSAHTVGVGAAETGAAAMAEATAAGVLAADNRVKIGEHTIRIDEHAVLITANRISAETALERVRATDIALGETNEAVVELTDAVETNFNAIKDIDETVVGNNQAIIALDQNLVNLSGTVGGNTTKIATNEAAILALDADNILKIGSDIEVASITSNGSFFMDELYIPPENAAVGNYTEVKGRYAFKFGDKGDILTFDDAVMDLKGKKLTGLHIPTDSTDAIRKAEFDPLSEKVSTNESGIVAVNTELTNQSSQISSLQTNSATKTELNAVSSDVSTLQSTALIKGVDADVDSTKFSVRNKPVKDIVDGTDESDAVSKKQLDQLNTTLTARIDGIETGGGVDLSGYAQLETDVIFNKIKIKNNNDGAVRDPELHVTGSENTIIDTVGNTYFNVFDKGSDQHVRAFYLDVEGRAEFYSNVKLGQIHGLESWTTQSDRDNAKYIKFDETNEVEIGAKADVKFRVNGNTPLQINSDNLTLEASTVRSDSNFKLQCGNVDNLEITETGTKMLRDVDMNTQNLKKTGDIEMENNRIILGGSARNLKLENIAGVHGTTVHSHGVMFNENEIVIDSPKITLKEDGANRLSIENHKIKMFTCQLKDLLNGEDDYDAVTLKQAKSFSSKTESFVVYSGTSEFRVSETDYPNPHIRYNNASTGTQIVYLDHAKNNNPVTVELRNESHNRIVELRPTMNGHNYNKIILPPHTHFTGFYAPALKNADGTTVDGQFYGSIGYIQVPPTNKNVFALAEDIPLEDMPADEIYLTGDQGIVETYLDDEGATQIRQVAGYNVPELENEINELQEHKDNNAPLITYFKNSNQVVVPYTHEHPTVKVQILDTAQPLQDTSLTLLDDDSGLYSGVYNNVGALSIGSGNTWITNYVYHNAYKHETANYYVVYDQSITNWVILSTDVLHTTANTDVGSVKINLNQTGTLPESTGSHTITLSVSDINSIEFADAIADTRIDEANKQVIVKFGSVYPSGKIIIS